MSSLSEYVGWVKVRASRILPPSDPLYDDLVQEGLIGAWMALTSYDSRRGALPFWVTFKAEGRMLDCVKNHFKWTGSPFSVSRSPSSFPTLVERPVCPHDTVPLTVDTRRALTAFLTPTQRRYVFLRFYLGFDSQDLTREFGYYPGAILGQVSNKLQTTSERVNNDVVCSVGTRAP